MLSLRQRIFVIISIAVGLIVAVLLTLLVLDRFTTEPTSVSTSTPSGSGVDLGQILDQLPGSENVFSPEFSFLNSPEEVTPPSPEETERQYVRQLARLFVERFGSFSNQNQNKHIDDVLPLVTPRMADWVNSQRVSQQAVYEGATARVIEHRVEEMADNQATVFVGVQELREGRHGEATVYRRGTVRLVRENDAWKVDGLFWEEE